MNVLDAPIAVLSRDCRVIYRNQAALALSRKFALNNNFIKCFEDGNNQALRCIERGRPVIAKIDLGYGGTHTALLVPDKSPEGTAAILALAPLLEGELCYEPSVATFSPQPFMPGTATLPGGKTLSQLGMVLINSYAALLSSEISVGRENFTLGYACAFLNRLYDRIFSYRPYEASAKCTTECVNMPIGRLSELFPLLACLSVIFTVNAQDRKLEVILHCQNERPVFSFFFIPRNSVKSAEGEVIELFEMFPGRKVELAILSAVSDRLGWDMTVNIFEKTANVELKGRERIPAYFFRSIDKEQNLYVLCPIEEILDFLCRPF